MVSRGRSATTEDEVLAAACTCFMRSGLRRTTIEDIANELGRSRPVVYRFIADKNDAFRTLAQRLLSSAAARAQAAATAPGTAADRVFGVLDVKLGVAVTLHHDGPHHADELLDEENGLVNDLTETYLATLGGLLVAVMSEQAPQPVAQSRAEILLALTRGLEYRLTDVPAARDRLREAVDLICP